MSNNSVKSAKSTKKKKTRKPKTTAQKQARKQKKIAKILSLSYSTQQKISNKKIFKAKEKRAKAKAKAKKLKEQSVTHEGGDPKHKELSSSHNEEESKKDKVNNSSERVPNKKNKSKKNAKKEDMKGENMNAFKETDHVTQNVEKTFLALSVATKKKKKVAKNAYDNALKTYKETYGENEALKIVKKLRSQKIEPSTKKATPKTKTKTMHISEFSASSSNGKGPKKQSSKKKSSEPKQQRKSWSNQQNGESKESHAQRMQDVANNKISRSGILHDIVNPSYSRQRENFTNEQLAREYHGRISEYIDNLSKVLLYLNDIGCIGVEKYIEAYKERNDSEYMPSDAPACIDMAVRKFLSKNGGLPNLLEDDISDLFNFIYDAGKFGSDNFTDFGNGMTKQYTADLTDNIIDGVKSINRIYTTVPKKPIPFMWQLKYRQEKRIPLEILSHFLKKIYNKITGYQENGDNETRLHFTTKLRKLIMDILAPEVGDDKPNITSHYRKQTNALSNKENHKNRYTISIEGTNLDKNGNPITNMGHNALSFRTFLTFTILDNDCSMTFEHHSLAHL